MWVLKCIINHQLNQTITWGRGNVCLTAACVLQLDFAARKKSDSKLQETFEETVKRFGDVMSSLG